MSVPRAVSRALEEFGLLLVTDKRLVSVVSILVGAPVRGSWWGHPKGHAIYNTCQALLARPDVISVKLVERKVTFVHQRLWPALFGAAEGREPWQTEGLDASARKLLKRVEASKSVELEKADAPARMLERRLLVHTGNVHTETGAHALVLETWPTVRKRLGWQGRPMRAAEGRAALDAAARRLAGL